MDVLGMDVLMEDGHCEHEHSGCSSTSTIDQDDIGCWNDWSPVVDWGPFSTDTNDFHGLIESMICDNINKNSDDAEVDYDCNGVLATSTVNEPSSTTTSEGTPPWALEKARPEVREEGDDKGLRLVHLLMAAAEALTGAHKSWDLARVILVRLKELVSPAGATSGTNMERLAAHFADALQGLLEGLPSTAGGPIRSAGSHHHHHQRDEHHHQPSDFLAAFQLLQDMSPYVKFGHFTANQAILESVSGERRVHIIDYDIMEGVQWASLMQAMVSRKDGPPPPHLRITAITKGGAGGSGSGRKAMGSVQETGRRLVAFASSIGQPFSFGQCRLDPDEKFRPSTIKLVKGETVIANCVLHPHLLHRSTNSVASFLTGAAALSAKIVTVVEEEEGETQKGEKESGFVGKFMDELHRYSAVWDSLEAGFPMQGRARGLVERVILGPRIASAVRRAYRLREEEEEEEVVEGDGGWGYWMSAMGFGRVGISYFNHCQARLLLGLFNDGYKVEEDAPNKLVLGWKSRRLISTSIWSLPPPPSPPQSTTSGSS